MTERDSSSSAQGDPDGALLDGVFGQFVADVAAGRAIVVETALPSRPDLADRVRELAALAHDVATRRGAVARPTIAGHEVLRELGRGGMAQVYLARDLRLGRVVALKVLPRRITSPRAKDRFLREARAVAKLDHPLVVPVYETGEDDGQPWFSMRYVPGRTLAQAIGATRESRTGVALLTGADFARSAGCTKAPPEPWTSTWARAAARAAMDVADALSHAHASGVVHRDVKPSNVLLRDDGFALLFDFGLADVEDEASLTLTHGFLGTPHYASPEQAAGTNDALDARSDVFSLGATLYEALTLQLPFPGPTTQEILRRVQTWEPEPPSKLVPGLPPDLETIVLHALEKDPAKRYATAAEFADDLRAFLAGRKIRARRAGMLERGLRVVKRNRALTELLVEQQSRNAELRAAVLRAERNEAEALAARRRAESALTFLKETLSSADPAQEGRDVRVADVLERGLARTGASFAGDPEAAAEIQTVIVAVLGELGRHAEAVALGRPAVDAACARLDASNAARIDLEFVWSSSAAQLGAPLGPARDAVEIAQRARRVFGPDDARTIRYDAEVGQMLEWAGRRDEAEATIRSALERARRVLGPDHEVSLRAEQNLGLILSLRAESADEGIGLLRSSCAARERTLGERHPETLFGLANLGQMLKEVGRIDEAVPLIRRASALSSEVFGPGHLASISADHNLAGVLLDAGRIEEAAALQRSVVDRALATSPPDSPLRAFPLVQLARLLHLKGDHAGAIDAVTDAARAAELNGSFRWREQAAQVHARCLADLGRHDEAEVALRDARDWAARAAQS
ncbi:MAG: serine/threonine-protein kinase [Planctomycetes bacterium]|nr:serine/threonine-protein kinase [Planctomycetota bacterium]